MKRLINPSNKNKLNDVAWIPQFCRSADSRKFHNLLFIKTVFLETKIKSFIATTLISLLN